MAHPDDFAFYQEIGCEVMNHSLGIQTMPEGYHLMLDADGMYFFWMEEATGRESAIHWSNWAVYRGARDDARSEEHTSELQSLMRKSYAVFCLKKKKTQNRKDTKTTKV